MGWVYYLRLFDTKFQAGCLKARLEDARDWADCQAPKYVGIFQTVSGRYGVKILW
jgi:hypothetical protein